jgi:hypothetical protein
MVESDSRNRLPAARRRAVLVALAALVAVTAAIGVYVAARNTGIFALQRIEVEGASPAVASQIRAALRSYVGSSLVRFDAAEAGRTLSTVPEVAHTEFDRAFPHTLKVRVRTERAVAVLRQASKAWLVSSSARVLGPLQRPYPPLPRVWVPASVDVALNSTLGGPGAQGVAALAPMSALHLPADVRQVRTGADELTLVLASGTEVRLGDSGDLRLKLAIAKQLLPVTAGAGYVDISVPERPVANFNPQVEG